MKVTTVRLELAKQVFPVHGVEQSVTGCGSFAAHLSLNVRDWGCPGEAASFATLMKCQGR